jgi:hypothetical protein
MNSSQSQLLPSPRREIPWLNAIDRFLRRHGYTQSLLDTSIFKNHLTIVALSDYGGDLDRCQYHTYAFLYTGWHSLKRWHDKVLDLKKKRFRDNRTIRYKDLGDGRRQKALPEWLSLADELPGHLIVITVDKRIHHLFKVKGMSLAEAFQSEGFSGYPDDIAEKTVRVLHILCYFAHFMIRPKNLFFWKTDEDEIAGSGGESIRREQLGKLFCRILNLYIPYSLNRVGYAAELEDEQRIFEDGLSLPDLSAGALADFFTPGAEKYVVKVKNRKEILLWLARKGTALHKLMFRLDFVDYTDSGEPLLAVKFLELNEEMHLRIPLLRWSEQ